MARIRTFIDSGVLIDAVRGIPPLSDAALTVLGDPNRILVSSDLVRLEVLPKPQFHKRRNEVIFYEAFFASLGRARLIAISKPL